MEEPFKPLVDLWDQKITHAIEAKEEEFMQYARECMLYYDGGPELNEHIFRKKEQEKRGEAFSSINIDHKLPPKPMFGANINKGAECEQLMGPAIYSRNPVPVVKPREFPSINPWALGPMGQMLYQQLQMESGQRRGMAELRAKLIQAVLVYSADEFNLRSHARLATSEAILKGRGVLWPELIEHPAFESKFPALVYDSVDNLQIDPDRMLHDAMFVARMRIGAYWEVERRFGLPRGSLRDFTSAHSAEAILSSRSNKTSTYRQKAGTTSDLVVYWDVYSKTGIGDRLSTQFPAQFKTAYVQKAAGAYEGMFDELVGDYVYLAVCSKAPYFLNLPPQLYQAPMDETTVAQIQQNLAWPVPYHSDNNGWPFNQFDPHPHPNLAWPTSHLKPGLGLLGFLNWSMAFLMDNVATTSRQFIAIAKGATEKIKQTIERGDSLSILEFEQSTGDDIRKIVQFLNHPSMNGDLLKVVELADKGFERTTGVNELLAGQTEHAYRSAAESRIKGEMTQIRPADMADAAELWLKQCFRSLALCAYRNIVPMRDLAPIAGQAHAMLWQQLITNAPIEAIVRELDYSMEVGSARRQNQQGDREQTQAIMQVLFPIADKIAASTGQFDLINKLLRRVAEVENLPPDEFQITPPAVVAQQQMMQQQQQAPTQGLVA